MLTREDKMMIVRLLMVLVAGGYMCFIRNEWTFVPNGLVYLVVGIILVMLFAISSYLTQERIEDE